MLRKRFLGLTSDSTMNRTLFAVAAGAALLTLQCSASAGENQEITQSSSDGLVISEQIPSYAPAILREKPPVARDVEDKHFADAARAAWAQINLHYYPNTGLVNAQPTWAYPTAWDIASTIGAYYSARGLGLIDDAEYDKRMTALLNTMKKARLYKNIAYGRNYDAKTGELVGPDQKPHQDGTGWSAMDLGRLLVMLAVVAKNDPEHADAARAVAARVNGSQVIKDGYLIGTELNPKSGKAESYQEGRIGYEQYAAKGFSYWNFRPSGALSARQHAKKANVLGIPIWADKRGLDRLTSEPFLMYGLEIGLDPEMREMAWQTLSAQAARFTRTGQMTMASEDAINQAPHYFYYYCVYCSGKPFVINIHTPGVTLNEPRWLSTKAAYGWHALLPSKYTWQAIQAVQPARDPKAGWASGVYEGSGKSTATYSLNTAAIMMEAALVRKTGKPLMEAAR